MRIIISAATTSDGYMDDRSPKRLVLSGEEDWREVYALRARCDAILVGAGTLRQDDPALIIKDPALRARRLAAGKRADILKAVICGSGKLEADFRFFTEGAEAQKIVFVRSDALWCDIARLHKAADVVMLDAVTPEVIIEELKKREVETLLVEGGPTVIKMFVDAYAVDEFRLAVAPFTLMDAERGAYAGKGNAPRLPYWGALPFEGCAVKYTHNAGRMKVTNYIINPESPVSPEDDAKHLQRAIDISRNCTGSSGAYSVGCVILTADGDTFEGYTHETSPLNHAEEEAITKAMLAGANLNRAIAYTSMEPCSTRKSKPVSCSELLIRHGFRRVVYAYAEPDCFVKCEGTRLLRESGIEVVVMDSFAAQVKEINSHIIG